MSKGRESSEHFRALRAEVVGIALVLAGLCGAYLSWAGVALCAIGAGLLGWSGASYMSSRGSVKAAAEKPRVVSAPKG